jgi:trans-2,3-dihydro-3-hydroxyanthranilate isomerase
MMHSFATLDVFTERRFAGNPLAVVFDADGFEGSTMQAVAHEFGHPETVFVLKPQAAGSTARVRIFTPAMELAFAGHPTIGTALMLALRRGAGANVTLEEKIGPVQCRVDVQSNSHGRASFIVPALPKPAGKPTSRGAISDALGLDPVDIGFGNFAPAKCSVGNTFTFIPVCSIDAVRRCHIDDAKWDAAFEANGQSFAFVFSRETDAPGRDFHARMFAPRAGVREDPATGSAVAAFSGLCAQALRLADGEHHFVIEQGFEMGRPSLIELGLTIRGGLLTAASVGGPAVVVTEGTIQA